MSPISSANYHLASLGVSPAEGETTRNAAPVGWCFTTAVGPQPPGLIGLGDAHIHRPQWAALAAVTGIPKHRQVWLRQVHSVRVAVVDECVSVPLAATDAVVTTQSDLVLVVLAADCVPVLLADPYAKIIGAVHAGRRGAAGGIVARTIETMMQLGASATHLAMWIGPHAGGCCYEVPTAMAQAVEATLPGSRTTTTRGTDGLALGIGIMAQAKRYGIDNITFVGGCTICDPTLYSYRRTGTTKRNAGVIWC